MLRCQLQRLYVPESLAGLRQALYSHSLQPMGRAEQRRPACMLGAPGSKKRRRSQEARGEPPSASSASCKKALICSPQQVAGDQAAPSVISCRHGTYLTVSSSMQGKVPAFHVSIQGERLVARLAYRYPVQSPYRWGGAMMPEELDMVEILPDGTTTLAGSPRARAIYRRLLQVCFHTMVDGLSLRISSEQATSVQPAHMPDHMHICLCWCWAAPLLTHFALYTWTTPEVVRHLIVCRSSTRSCQPQPPAATLGAPPHPPLTAWGPHQLQVLPCLARSFPGSSRKPPLSCSRWRTRTSPC